MAVHRFAVRVSSPANFPRRDQANRRLLLTAVMTHARLCPAALAGPPIGAGEKSFAHWFTVLHISGPRASCGPEHLGSS